MRIAAWMLGGLFASSAVMPANAGSGYSKCVDAANPPECIARRAVKSSGVRSEYVLEAVLRHGLADLVPKNSDRLMRGLYDGIGHPDEKIDTPEEQLVDSTAAAALRASPPRSILAAMALIAAARHETEPFSNPVYLKLAKQAKNDPRIPVLALGLWGEVVGMSGSPPDFEVTHVGLAAIWNRAVARKEQDADLLEDVAGTLAFMDELKPQAREFYLWYASRPGLTAGQRVSTASQMGRYFQMHEQAASLLQGIGDDVEGWDVRGVRNSLAVARLRSSGYDAEAARILMGEIFDEFSRNGIRFGAFGSAIGNEREALEQAGAREELRELGAECLRRADSTDFKYQASEWLASASDFYRRAGDLERAREVARRGLPYVPELVRQANESLTGVNRDDPTAMAVAAQGRGTSPVIALYRAGAIDEALKSGYLTGKDRYRNAELAGEEKDPQWVIDDGWKLWIDAMVHEASRSTDREFQQRAYDALVRSCKKPLADCFDEKLRNIAEVAAGMGDEARMKEALAAAARQLDRGWGMGFHAMYVAGPWAHCEEVLRSAKQSLAQQGN
jgi:hypothetical protein